MKSGHSLAFDLEWVCCVRVHNISGSGFDNNPHRRNKAEQHVFCLLDHSIIPVFLGLIRVGIPCPVFMGSLALPPMALLSGGSYMLQSKLYPLATGLSGEFGQWG